MFLKYFLDKYVVADASVLARLGPLQNYVLPSVHKLLFIDIFSDPNDYYHSD